MRPRWGRPLDVEQAATAALVVVPALSLAVLGWSRRWTHDDGFINYRIVTMLRSGHGPVVNAGERVEAYTSPAWLGALTLGDLTLPAPTEWVGVVLGIGFAALGMAGMVLGSLRLTRIEGDRWWLPLGALVPLGVPPVWDFVTSGLENGLSMCWLGLVTLALGRWSTSGRPPTVPEAVLIGFGPLVRPELVIYTVLLLAVLLGTRWADEDGRTRIRVLGAALALPAAYQLFRMGYFAALVPNTALAKSAARQRWSDGWGYLTDVVGTYLLVVPLSVVALALAMTAVRLDRQRRLALLVLPAAAVLHTLYVMRSGGDYMHARLLLPALSAFVAPCAVVPVRAMKWPVLAGSVMAATALWSGVSATTLRSEGVRTGDNTWVVDHRASQVASIDVAHPVTAAQQGWGRGSDQMAYLVGDRVFLDRDPLDVRPAEGVSTPLLATHGLGLPSYSVSPSTYVLDRLGLADALTSRFEVATPGLIGHEKPIPGPWLNARVSDELAARESFLIVGGPGVVPLYESSPSSWPDDVAIARRVLQCEPLLQLQAAITEPLSVGRVWQNLVEAPSLTALSVPPNPTEAEAKLCDGDG